MDKGLAIREKSILISDLMNYPARLEEEREQARHYREKFYNSQGNYQGSGNVGHQANYGGYGGSKHIFPIINISD